MHGSGPLAATGRAAAKAEVREMCEKLLVTTVTETFTVMVG
jgi:phosphoribosylformylglycinamidine (FGAM) synthase PurS component